MDDKELEEILTRVKRTYKTIVVDAFLVSEDGSSILMQKRSLNRKLFPGFWDAFGGHREGSESLRQTIEREVAEESQMKLTEILRFVHEFEWPEDPSVVNLQFLCRAVGNAKFEADKVTEVKWIKESDVADLSDSLTGEMRQGVLHGFAAIKASK